MTRFRRFVLLATVLLPTALWALEVQGPYVRGLPPTQKNTAAFFILSNPTAREACLRAGSSEVAERLEIHRHRHNNNGMMSMQREEQLCIPAGESVEFAPGGIHLMLISLHKPLRDGDQVELSLELLSGEMKTFIAPVISVLKEHDGQRKSHSHHEHHGHGGDK